MKKFLFITLLIQCVYIMPKAQINRMYKSATTTSQASKVANNNPPSSKFSNANVGAAAANRVVASYNGMINISPDIASKMQSEWQASPDQLGGSFLKAALWTVTYQPDPKRPGYTEILLQQPVNTLHLSYQSIANGVSYSISSLPAGTNLAVIVYSNSLSSVPGLSLRGKPDDGGGQSVTHRYESNAKRMLGQNIIYGVYSIVPGKTDLNHIDFNFAVAGAPACKTCFGIDDVVGAVEDIVDFATKVINGVTYVFDQVVDGMADLAKFVFQGGLSLPGFFINEAGQLFYEFAGGLINLIAYGNWPQERDLTQAEYDFLVSRMFQGADIPPRSSIKVFNFMTIDHRFYTIPGANGNIYMNVGDAFNDLIDAVRDGYPAPGQVFVHEFTHAWQIKHNSLDLVIQGFNNQVIHGGSNSVYQPDCSSISNNFNFEQQATIVDMTYASLYYPTNGTGHMPCSFDMQWVVENVRKGTPFDLNAIAATNAMKSHSTDPAINSFTGKPIQDLAVYSKGNASDGDGYYMSGSVPGSFLYFNNRDKKPYANWGDIRKKYEAESVEFGILGWPVADELSTPKRQGVYQYFKRGVIYSSPSTGAHILSGPIQKKWSDMGYENSRLGFPKSDPVYAGGSSNGNFRMQTSLVTSTTQVFEGGELFLTTSTAVLASKGNEAPVHAMYNNLLSAWNSGLGFPISDQVSVPAKPASITVYRRLAVPAFDSIACQNANLYWSANFGARVVSGEILNLYKSLGGVASSLGLPTGDELKTVQNSNAGGVINLHAGDYYQPFQGGTIYFSMGRASVQYTDLQNQTIQNKSFLNKNTVIPKKVLLNK